MKSKFLRCVLTAAGIACCSMCLFVTPAATMPVQAAASAPTVSPQKDITIWYFKEEDNKLWKRLWNATKYRWETDWVYVCDL